MKNATVYSPAAAPPSESDVRACAPGATVKVHAQGLLRRTITGFAVSWPHGELRLSLMPSEALPQHLAGFGGYVHSRIGTGAVATRLTERIGATRHVIGCVAEGDTAGTLEAFARALAARTGGLLFLPPGDVFDERGVQHLSFAQVTIEEPDDDAEDLDDEEPDPPTVEAILDRAQVLCAVTHRALLETAPPPNAEAQRTRALEWLRGRSAASGLEAAETEWLTAQHPAPVDQRCIDACWRAEGLAVLAWSLGLLELPPHDVAVGPVACWRAVGFLADDAEVERRIRPRSPAEIDWQQRRLLGIHWRLRDFRLRPEPLDFRAFAAKSWFGGFDADGIPVAEGDLSIGGVALAEAPADAVAHATSIAVERHRAINWIAWGGVYSKVGTDT